MKYLLPILLSATSFVCAADNVRDVWQKAQYRFTPEVEAAFLDAAKDGALKKLAVPGKTLPADFLAWIDSDPVVKTTVYGARQDPAGILLMLRSLELDLGQDVVRRKYTQLALATAVVFAKDGEKADLTPRAPLKLVIGGDPRKPVNTKDSNRTLDLNDHIINFLNDNTLEEDVVVGQKEELPELKYDSKGIAIPPPKGKRKMIPVTEKRTRTLYAADVIASKAWQEKFNAYLKAHGQTVQIDCGDKIVHWKSHDMVRGERHKKIAEAFKMFRTAYEAKGLLPAERDPIPTPAERCAYLIRNNEYKFPTDVKWPRYPLTAPWPTLTLLVENNQPLREREERWLAFRDKGEFRSYGEYIGNVAQQFDMQSARRIKEYPFTYGTIQMMLKDGGVCGTMANIAVRSHCTLGTPACSAGQPGHCALIVFAFDQKTVKYRCHGGQYATGGDAQTSPHGTWAFGDVDARRPMVYHQSIAWSVNRGLQSYLDSTVAHTFFKQLPDLDQRAYGLELLQSAAALCPYNILLADDAITTGINPTALVAFWKTLKPAIAEALYITTIKAKLFARLAALPVPGDVAKAGAILAFLQEEKCENQSALANYKIATAGLPALLTGTAAQFTNHLASARTDAGCATMADALNVVAGKIADKKQRAQWALARWQEIQGREMYLGHKNAITADKSLAVLAKLAGQKARPEINQVQSLLDQITNRLKLELAAPRTPQTCKQLAGTITSTAKQIKDATQKRQWLEVLAKTIDGKEQFQIEVKKKTQTLRDPCADTIAQLQKEQA
jgi:hypothetical protein